LLAIALGIGLFTSLGTGGKAGPPQVGAQAPTFSLPGLNRPGSVGHQIGDGSPTVVLFFANWCSVCDGELPALAKAVKDQEDAHGPLSKIQVIGVDSLDLAGNADDFVKSSGVTFPVGFDGSAEVMSGKYDLYGPPYAFFIAPDGKVVAVKASTLTTKALFGDERRLLTS
jgi:thiol-disulfide isomerase/thioredoxin